MNLDATTTSVDTASVDIGGATSTPTTITDLPQPLLIHIHSFLPLPQAIQASFVCRSFGNLWHSLPSLHFDIFDYYSRSTYTHPRSDYSRQVFADLISQTLNSRQLNPLTKLQITFEYTNFDVHKFNIQSWIRHAVNLSVSELCLDFTDERKFHLWKDPDDDVEDEGHRLCTFDFHLLDIGKSCIETLKLCNCWLMLPRKTNPIEFASLKSLELERVMIGRQPICNLLARCVNLETLKLTDMEIHDPEESRIYSDSLKEFCIEGCSSGYEPLPMALDICCPRLEKISLIFLDVGKYTIKDTTRLVEARVNPRIYWVDKIKECEKMLSFFTNISTLQVWDELLESNEVPAGCEQFASNVKHLEFYCSYNENDLVGLAALLKLFPKLEILGLNSEGRAPLEDNLDRDHRKASTVFNMPCLKKVILRSYHKTKREQHFIKLFKKNGTVLDKIELLRPSNQKKYYKY